MLHALSNIILQEGKKVYFASDFHLGVPNDEQSLLREKKIVQWLCDIEIDAQHIFLVGDIFDFWFEYKTVVPRGYTRLLGKLASLCDKGIKVHYFTGNHDMWTFGYLEKELGVSLYRNPIEVAINNKKFFIGHGDGLGPGDKGYKFIKKVFASSFSQWLFARLHPNFGIGLANFWSGKSRAANGPIDEIFMGEEKEWLIIYCKEVLQKKHFDFFIFGHRHLLLDIALPNNARYVNLGDWFKKPHFAVFNGQTLLLEKY
ncbi:MAG TPA: UDP-2,3-diacylglucosamine diphosphatase [Bacteroidia bacterium]|nr:UDP-2,3-diacylglucosamine diphosphatase [Bacteroidia bacterium]